MEVYPPTHTHTQVISPRGPSLSWELGWSQAGRQDTPTAQCSDRPTPAAQASSRTVAFPPADLLPAQVEDLNPSQHPSLTQDTDGEKQLVCF